MISLQDVSLIRIKSNGDKMGKSFTGHRSCSASRRLSKSPSTLRGHCRIDIKMRGDTNGEVREGK